MRVAGPMLHDPARVEVAPSATPVEAVSQAVYPVAEVQKIDLLVRLLEEEKLDRVLVFTRTKHRADRVCRHLERSRIKGTAIHSNRTPGPAPARARRLQGRHLPGARGHRHRGPRHRRRQHLARHQLRPALRRPRTTCTASAARPAPAPPARPSASWPPSRRTSCATSSCMLGQPLPCRTSTASPTCSGTIPNPDRTAKKPKPRLVYNGSARRRSR